MKSRKLLLLVFCLLTCLFAIQCGQGDDDDSADDDLADDDVADDDVADDDAIDDDLDDDAVDDDTAEWEPVEPHREDRGIWTVVWLSGTPYEMGYQQGELLHEELAAGIDWLNTYHLIDLLLPLARLLGLLDLAYENSYPDIIEECRGISDAAGDVGWEMDVCMLLNFGDMLVEFLSHGIPPAKKLAPGCSQAVATGPATVDGRLYHARSLDWDKIDFLLDYPVVFVRQPDDGIPHAFIGFPGNLSPYSGMNAAGVSLASNEVDPSDNSQHDRVGRSHVQMQAQLLKHAHSLAEARAMIEAADHMTVETIVVADGIAQEAASFEMTAKLLGIRELENNVLYATNHFVAPATENADAETSESSARRFDRLAELIPAGGEDTYYGEIDPETMVSVLRDRTDPWTGLESPPDVFDDDHSIATNGAIYQIVFDPENLLFWVAAGAIPVPQQTFVGFSLGELLELPGAVPCDPEVIE